MSEDCSLGTLAQQLGAEVVGDSKLVITGIASIQAAKLGEITFLASQHHRRQLGACQASAVMLTAADLPYWQHSALIVTNPYLSYARLAQLLDTTPRPKPGIAASAVLADGVRVGANVAIGDYTVIEAGVHIGDGSIIGAHCFIGENAQIGCNTRLWMQVSIYHAVIIGNNCLIHAGAVIGSDGFGFANDQGEWVKIPQLGTVLIGNNVEIGACTTIDRGALDNTIIGDGVIIDNQCQIAHNVVIGAHTAVAGGALMAGGLKIGCYCKIGGASAIKGHMEICDRVTITGMAMVMRPITKPGIYSSGVPLQPNATWRKTAVHLLRINDMAQRVTALERTIKQLQITSVP